MFVCLAVIIDKLGHKILSKIIVDSTSEDEETKWRRYGFLSFGLVLFFNQARA